MDEKLKELYKALAKKVISFNKDNKNKHKLTICPAIQGSKDAKIMIVGRAINSWCKLDDSYDIEELVNQVERCSNCSLDWVNSVENYYKGCEGCSHLNTKDKTKKDLCSSKSPFWKFAKYIADKDNDGTVNQNWIENIIWTNLYKASYDDGGNPKGFYTQQLDICNNILIREIELYKPRIIYFITEKNSRNTVFSWFTEEDFGKVKSYLDKKNISYIITRRPEFRKFDELYNEMIKK